MLQTFRLCRFQARYQILQTQIKPWKRYGEKSTPQNVTTGTSNLVRRIPKYAWNENKKEDYLTRGIFSILFFCGHCE